MALKRLYEPQRASQSLYMTELRNTHFIGRITRRILMFGTVTKWFDDRDMDLSVVIMEKTIFFISQN